MSKILDAAEVAAIEERANRATAGPWLRDPQRDRTIFAAEDGMIGGVLYNTNGGDDAEFIAASRSDVPRLCEAWKAQAARIAELEAENERLRAHDEWPI